MGDFTNKHVPVAFTEAVETIRKGGLQPAHALDQVWLRRLNAQMVMVAQQAPRIQTPLHRRASLLQTLQKTLMRSRILF